MRPRKLSMPCIARGGARGGWCPPGPLLRRMCSHACCAAGMAVHLRGPAGSPCLPNFHASALGGEPVTPSNPLNAQAQQAHRCSTGSAVVTHTDTALSQHAGPSCRTAVVSQHAGASHITGMQPHMLLAARATCRHGPIRSPSQHAAATPAADQRAAASNHACAQAQRCARTDPPPPDPPPPQPTQTRTPPCPWTPPCPLLCAGRRLCCCVTLPHLHHCCVNLLLALLCAATAPLVAAAAALLSCTALPRCVCWCPCRLVSRLCLSVTCSEPVAT